MKDREGRILISLRHDTSHQGGLWEFPGGKVEPGESVKQALARELKEELSISVQEIVPLIGIKHQYADLNVFLDVWTVTLFSGEPMGLEGQMIKWVSPEQLTAYAFPEANYPIISAAKLPAEYAILNGVDEHVLLEDLSTILDNGVKLIQARIKLLSASIVMRFFELAIPLCKEKGAILLVNSDVKNADKINADGIHLTARDLLACKQRPVSHTWVAASCHNQVELQYAEKIGVDFVVLAPVLPTKTHPDVAPMGWKRFKQLTTRANIPVFALGGMTRQDKYYSQLYGGQGIAGITAFLL